MKNFKKLFAPVLAASLVAAAFAGCGETASNPTTPASDGGSGQTEADKTYKVGIVQLVQHPALDEATQGFIDVLTEKLGDKVEIDNQNASNDSATCSTIVNQFISAKTDLIFANATPALQAAATATADIPIVGTSITDYATALDIDDWTGVTGRNITGTADLAPLAEQAAMFKELVPDAQKIGLLYCSAEANSKYQCDIVAEELANLGYETAVYTFADSNDVAAVTQAACAASDALYIPTDNTAASNTELIASIVIPANIPVIAGEEGICQGCGVATLSISYYSIGQVAGEMAYDILVNGANPAEMEIKYATDLTKKYVAERAEALGLAIPEGYEPIATEE